MTDPREPKPRLKPWRWSSLWIREESFWRDVASRSMAGVFVVAFGYFGAVVLGYLAVPPIKAVLASVAAFIVYIAYVNVLSYFFLRYGSGIEKRFGPTGWRVELRVVLGLLVWGGLMFAGVIGVALLVGLILTGGIVLP